MSDYPIPEKRLCSKCGHTILMHKTGNKLGGCHHSQEYRPYGFDPNKDKPQLINCSCKVFLKIERYKGPSKPKTSTIDKISDDVRVMTNTLLSLCSTFYDLATHPPKKGKFRSNQMAEDPEVVTELKGKILKQSLLIGERLWYPRGNPGLTNSINQSVFQKRKREK